MNAKSLCLEHQDEHISGKRESLGATEHTKSCHEKFDWLHLETLVKLKTLLEKQLHESFEIKHLEVKTATINLKLYY